LPVSKGEQWGWASLEVLGPIALAVVLFVAWVAVERRAADPLVDMRLMRERPVWTLNLASLLFGFVLMGFMSFLPLFVQTPEEIAGYGFSATVTESGLFLLPMTIAMMVAGPVAGWLTSRAGGRSVVIFGAVAVAASSSLFAISHDSSGVVYVVTALAGLGVGSAFSAMSALIVTTVRPEQVGIATGMNANVRTVGGSIGIAVMTAIVTSSALPNGVPQESGYANGFWFFAAMALVAMLAAFLVRSESPGPQAAAETAAEPEDELARSSVPA
jgi:MFS family permease